MRSMVLLAGLAGGLAFAATADAAGKTKRPPAKKAVNPDDAPPELDIATVEETMRLLKGQLQRSKIPEQQRQACRFIVQWAAHGGPLLPDLDQLAANSPSETIRNEAKAAAAAVRAATAMAAASKAAPKTNAPTTGDAPREPGKSVVIVVQRSGQMDPVGEHLKLEVLKAVFFREEGFRFNVLFFAEGDPQAFAARPVAATADNKKGLIKFLSEIQFRGSADPVAAMQAAIRMSPDEILLIVGRDFETDSAAAVAAANRGKVRINCLAYEFPGGQGFATVQRLAAVSGGRLSGVDLRKMIEGEGAFKGSEEEERKAALGLEFRALSDAAKSQLGLAGGLTVTGVSPDSRAWRAGIRQDDILVTADGIPLDLPDVSQIRTYHDRVMWSLVFGDPNRRIAIEYLREGKKFSATIPSVPESLKDLSFGAKFAELDPQLRRQLGIRDGAGVIVEAVRPDSRAAKLGILRHDIVTAINGQTVRTVDEAAKTPAADKPLTFDLLRTGKPMKLAERQ